MSHQIGLFDLTGHAVRTILTTPLTTVVIGVAVAATQVGIMCVLFEDKAGRN